MPVPSKDDLVTIGPFYARAHDHGQVYRVTKINKTTASVEPIAGGRTVRVPFDGLVPAAPEQINAATTIPYQPPLHPGTLVTVAGRGWKQPADALYVVIKEKADTKVTLAVLGGDARYWPNVPRDCITPLSAASAAEAAAAAIKHHRSPTAR